MSYFAATAGVEEDYQKAVETGCLTVDEFKKRCASHGFTEQANGSSWDDKCMAWEAQQKIPPCAARVKNDPNVARNRLYLIGGLGAAAVLLIVLVR